MSPTAVSDLVYEVPMTTPKAFVKTGQHFHGMEDIHPLKAISHGDVTLSSTDITSAYSSQPLDSHTRFHRHTHLLFPRRQTPMAALPHGRGLPTLVPLRLR
jgi:hypothetical protein